MMIFGLGSGSIVPGLELDRYRQQIKLDEPYQNVSVCELSSAERNDIVTRLLDQLIHREHLAEIEMLPPTHENRRRLLRGLLNARPPQPIDSDFIYDINRLLYDETNRWEIVEGGNLPVVSDTLPIHIPKNMDKLVLWRGDISRLRVDAIVNAANDQLLGCFHTAAQLHR